MRLMRSAIALVLALVASLVWSSVSVASSGNKGNSPNASASANAGASSQGAQGGWSIEVKSSPPEYVSDGDARLWVTVPPGQIDKVLITLDGRDVTSAFEAIDKGKLEGVVDGLVVGENTVEVRPRNSRGAASAALTLTNYPVTGPMFSGPQQTPFWCSTDGHRGNAELGPITDRATCSTDRVVSFKYRNTSGAFVNYDPAAPRPADMAKTTTTDGKEVDFIIRWERGTINRFIYSIAMLSPETQTDSPDLSAWNKRLIYSFQGGVGIGHYQGNPSRSAAFYDYGLSSGYAVVYSTGNKTGEHYNLQLGGETAIMVKDRFVSAYGVPEYTVAVGGSGGGIQQYIYAQNHPGLIDAAIPQYSYPDMVTQTIHIGDCELLGRWMDLRVIGGDGRWKDWQNRTRLIGLNATDAVPNPTALAQPYLDFGADECQMSWRGLSPLALNPHFGTVSGITPQEQADVHWTHWEDLVNIYGRAEDGFARSAWDNVGVQYGLQALTDGWLPKNDFLTLNAQIGGWKNEPDMVQEGCPFIEQLCAVPNPEPDVWSLRNQTFDLANPAAVAPRTEADPGAIEAAYTSGIVNHGDIEIPVIDWRNYLERELDMHNSHQSFAARQRLLDWDGDASNQVIWFTDVSQPGGQRYDQTPLAFQVIDEWMANIAANPKKSVAANRPARAVDSCFDTNGALIYAGADAWAGILDDRDPGACTQEFELYSTSRIVAGAPITGDVFKCELQSVESAIARGVYGDVEFSPVEVAQLKTIFPTGVCDYTLGDSRRPANL